MRRRLLLVEDDPTLRQALTFNLAREGYEVSSSADGESALEAARNERLDLILLDVMLPGMSGLEVLRALRRDGVSTPIIVLSAKGDEIDRVVGLKVGADDYVSKPFSPNELIARARALLRRARRTEPEGTLLRYRSLIMDVATHVVSSDGREVRLTAKEFMLLQYMLQRQGRVLSRDLLLSDVWGYQYTGGTRTVDVHIRRLREKLPFLADAIVTIKQFGYRLEER